MSRLKSKGVPPKEFFEKEALSHLVQGDLFSYAHPVIPIKTKGRWYGSLSRALVDRGVALPVLTLCQARYVEPYIVVALWDDDSLTSEENVFSCAATCFEIASARRFEQVAFPILGGKGGEKFLWAAERGIFEAGDFMDAAGFHIPEHVYVTDKVVD